MKGHKPKDCNNLSLVWYKATNVWHTVIIESIRGVIVYEISLLTSTHKHLPKVLYFHKMFFTKKGQILHFDSNQITGKVGLVLTTEDRSTFDNISLFCYIKSVGLFPDLNSIMNFLKVPRYVAPKSVKVDLG